MSETHMEYVDSDYSVTIQHCEFIKEDGVVCNQYLGVNYPLNRCYDHRPKK